MRVREKTYISLWTSSLRKEETLNVNLQLIRSRYFFNRAAFPQLDSYSLTPGLMLNPKSGKYILENHEVIKHVYCRKYFRQIHLLLLTQVTNDPINVCMFLILFSTLFCLQLLEPKKYLWLMKLCFFPIPSKAFLFLF